MSLVENETSGTFELVDEKPSNVEASQKIENIRDRCFLVFFIFYLNFVPICIIYYK